MANFINKTFLESFWRRAKQIPTNTKYPELGNKTIVEALGESEQSLTAGTGIEIDNGEINSDTICIRAKRCGLKRHGT